jgi:hypothetical protein
MLRCLHTDSRLLLRADLQRLVVGMTNFGSDKRVVYAPPPRLRVHETGRQGQSSGLSHYIFPIDLGMGISNLGIYRMDDHIK